MARGSVDTTASAAGSAAGPAGAPNPGAPAGVAFGNPRGAGLAAGAAAASSSASTSSQAKVWHPRMNKYPSSSLFMCDRSNKFRERIAAFIEWPWFDRFILVLILANSVVLALTDYQTLDANGDPSNESWRNYIVDATEPFFTYAFAVECGLKIITMGFCFGKGSYLRDGWNILDFVVVVTGLLANIPNMPNISAFRTVRVLRPLRSLTVLPEMQKLVMSLLASIPGLFNVVLLLGFMFTIFSILGVQLWAGIIYARCRTTPWPVKMIDGCEDPLSEACLTALATNVTERCMDVPNNDDSWNQETSPWAAPQDCFWPIYAPEQRVCSLAGTGNHECGLTAAGNASFCGSDYDDFGNPRFMSAAVMERSNFALAFNWGITGFDHIAMGLLTIFQVITMEGWTEVMYHIMDSYNAVAAALYFIFLVLFGSFFLLNLTLAVIWDNFAKGKEEEVVTQVVQEEQSERELEPRTHDAMVGNTAFGEPDEATATAAGPAAGAGLGAGSGAGSEAGTTHAAVAPASNGPDAAAGQRRGSDGSSDVEAQTGRNRRNGSTEANPVAVAESGDLDAAEAGVVDRHGSGDGKGTSCRDLWCRCRWRHTRAGSIMNTIVTSSIFTGIIIVLICINTIVLAADYHPMDPAVADRLEIVNFILTVAFTIEMFMKMFGLGLYEYGCDAFNLFDCFIVLVSLVELIVLPPSFMSDAEGASSGGAISALRTFRLFRVFKLARSWRSLNVLLKNIVKTLADIANFAVLLLLFMYIFSLVGMQFFANKFCFHPTTGKALTGVITSCPAPYIKPRAHFDNILWAFVTVFQILTGENWNTVMYDGTRATGWTASLYFVALVVLGNFIVLNLFLAILLGNFEGNEELTASTSTSIDRSNRHHTVPPTKRTMAAFQWRHIMNQLRRIGRRNKRVAPAGADMVDDADRAGAAAAAAAAAAGGNTESGSAPGTGAGLGAGVGAELAGKANAGEAAGNQMPTNRVNVKPVNRGLALDDTKAAAPAYGEPQSPHKQILPPMDGNGSERSGSALQHRHAGKQAEAGDDAVVAGSRQELLPHKTAGAGAGGRSRLAAHAHPSDGGEEDDDAVRSEPAPEMVRHSITFRGVRDLVGRALWLMGPKNRVRTSVSALVQHPAFDNVILALIILSSIMLAIDNPLVNPESALKVVLDWSDIVFTAVFTLEFLLKIITFGFLINGPDSYLRSGWNQLDFVIVVVSLLSLSASDDNPQLQGLHSLRTLRALRPLRVISRRPGLKLVVSALFSSIKAILNVLFVCVLFFLIFGIVGVNYFKGQFMRCDLSDLSDSLVPDLVGQPQAWAALSLEERSVFSTESAAAYAADWAETAPTSRVVCEYLGASWEESVSQSFDNIMSAMGALFEMSTTEGWVDVMYAAVDANGVDMQPQRDVGWPWVFFFMGFMVVGSFFVMNLFVGVVIDNFNTMKERLGDDFLLDDEQKELVKTLKRMIKRVPQSKRMAKPKHPVRAWCFVVIQHPAFEGFIMSCIVLNTVVMAMNYYGESHGYTAALEWVNLVFAIIFTFEAIIKLTALKLVYFTDNWNNFDFLIVVGTNVGLLLKFTISLNIGPIATVIRTFRVGRILRLIKSAKSLRKLFQTLLLTLPSLGNIGGLLFLLFFIYAVMGVQLFARVQLMPGSSLDVHANFQSFTTAVVTLMRASTGEAWNQIMYDMATRQPGCADDPKYDPLMCGFEDSPTCIPLNGCGTGAAYPFFISFTLFVTFVFLNMFIAVILEGSSNADDTKVSDDDMQEFFLLWEEYDPSLTRKIHTSDLERLLLRLPRNLGFDCDPQEVTPQQLQQRICDLRIPIFAGNMVMMRDVARALVDRHFENAGVIPAAHQINKELKNKFKISDAPSERSNYATAHYYAAMSVQNAFLAYKFRKKIDARIDEKENTKRVDVQGAHEASDDDDDA